MEQAGIFSIEQLTQQSKEDSSLKAPESANIEKNETQATETEKKVEQPTGEAQQSEEQSKAQPTENKQEPTVDVDKLVEDKIKQLKESGEFIDKSTYEQSLAEREIKNDFLKKLAELDKGTGKVNKEFLRNYLTDWDSYDTSNQKQVKKLLVQDLMNAEGFDSETATLELETKYPALFEEDPDTESREYQRQLKLSQHEAKKFIAKQKQEQESLALKDPEQFQSIDRDKVIEEYTTQQSQKQQEIFNAWKDYSDLVIEKVGDKLVHEVEGNQFEITLSEQEKSTLKNLVENTPRLPDLFFKEGKLDESAYQDFLLYGLLGRKTTQSVVKDAIAMGEEKKFNETKSATTTANQVIPTNQNSKKVMEDILKKHGIAV